METKFNFNSQVATSRSQSERLMALGLKKETADMHYALVKQAGYPELDYFLMPSPITNDAFESIPAWSLHRLCDMMPKCIAIDGDSAYPLQITKRYDGQWVVGYQGWYDCVGDLYDNIIFMYQLLISEGYIDEEFYNKN